MSLKLIEMQIALPRTMEAGKIQEQLQQRGQNMNDFAAQASQKEEEQKRKTVIKQEQKSNVKLTQEEKDHNKGTGSQGNRNDKSTEMVNEKKEQHPYKGIVIDYSG
ncbi:hypothetical protein BGM26_02480 [Bacillus sp. FJAT-29790]|nr:hypothetical protein [Bacillus sp. FJAT-29790]MBU8877858.1 hypothetical protein [Bacillus sp. FJAT-29790]